MVTNRNNIKLKLAKLPDTKVVFINNVQSEIMLDITASINKMYKSLAKKSGRGISHESFLKKQLEFLSLANNIEGYLDQISKEFNLDYSKSIILKQCNKLNEERIS